MNAAPCGYASPRLVMRFPTKVSFGSLIRQRSFAQRDPVRVAVQYDGADEPLVRAAKGGDGAAMTVLLEKYRDLVQRRARSFFIVGADRDDVFQEGMIGLFKAVRDFRSEKLSNFRVFATLCINRQIMTALKAATRQKHAALNTSVSLYRPVYADGAATLLDVVKSPRSIDPLEYVVRQEEDGAVQRSMSARLSDFERSVLSLYLDGKSYREISDVLDRGPKAVDNALQRIKRKIRHHLDDRATGREAGFASHGAG